MIVATLFAAAVTLQAPTTPRLPGTGELSFLAPGAAQPTLCALRKTEVDANVDGFGARVTVVQTFRNSSTTPVEAVYKFPLPNDSAVDRMRIQVGPRIIEGELKPREEARAIYEQAKNAGQTASLLDQERANIFTQSIANLMPGAEVKVEISYAQILKYENGQYEFSFPMTIGPRYMSASTPDPQKIATSYAPPGTRTGADIDLRVHLNAGAPIKTMNSVLHKIRVKQVDAQRDEIDLAKSHEIPNRDFILKYSVATDSVQNAFLSHFDQDKGGFFSMVLLPPKAPTDVQIAPKELIFVMDQSGSQNGFPIEKSKELTLKMIDKMRPNDTFNVMGFSNEVTKLWPGPRPNTAQNRAEAATFIRGMNANGGTELHKAVIAALAPAPDPRRLRYVVFNTDGFVGHDKEIVEDVTKYRQTSRLFAFGIGNSVNRDLIDSMSTEGRGDSEVVTLNDNADEAVTRFLSRSGNPILSNVTVSCDEATEITPSVVPDVLSDKPIVISGRYSQGGKGHILVSGTFAGKPWSKNVEVNFPIRNDNSTAVMSLWARRKLDDMRRDGYVSALQGRAVGLKDPITKVALTYGIMSEYTSFVAVEKRIVNVGGKSRTVTVPLDAPDGVDMNMAGGTTVLARNRVSAPGATGFARGGLGGGGRAGGGPGGGAGFSGVTGASAATSVGTPVTLSAKAGQPTNLQDADGRVAEQLSASKIAPQLMKVKSGLIEIQIGLTDLKPETLKKLEQLGFKLDVKLDDLKVVIGKIDVKALKALAELKEVKAIGPDRQ